MKDSLIKVTTASTVWYAQLFEENLLQSSVKFQLETIRHDRYSRMLKSRCLRLWRVPSLWRISNNMRSDNYAIIILQNRSESFNGLSRISFLRNFSAYFHEFFLKIIIESFVDDFHFKNYSGHSYLIFFNFHVIRSLGIVLEV